MAEYDRNGAWHNAEANTGQKNQVSISASVHSLSNVYNIFSFTFLIHHCSIPCLQQ